MRPQNRSAFDVPGCARLHLQFGWWSLLAFLSLGVVLETLHAFKIAWYLDVANKTRRLMWTLAHAHGSLLGLVNVAFGLTAQLQPRSAKQYYWASRCLLAASLMLPMGFFLGGIFIYGGDPGLGALLVPIGAVPLFVAVYLTARGSKSQSIGQISEGETPVTKGVPLRKKSRRG